MDYLQNALEITNKLNVELIVKFVKNDYHFEGDTQKRDIYKITLKRGSRKFSFNFGQSVNKSQYYQDSIKGRTYSLDGKCRTGNYSITDINKYVNGGNKLTLIKGVEPNMYDVMTCLQKYDIGTFENFCDDFGYDVDSRKAEKTYNAVLKEYENMCMLFSDSELELLAEIQ